MTDISTKIRRWLSSEKIRTLEEAKENVETAPVVDLPIKRLIIEGLDTALGISLAGSEELYRTILGEYYALIEKKATLIEGHIEAENVEAFTIEVHALKSASKLIGAIELSELAAKLERWGHEKKWALISPETETLLRLYRGLLATLQPYAQTESCHEEVELSPEVLAQRLEALYEALDNFDLDGARVLAEELAGCRLDEEEVALRQKLTDAVHEMEYDDAAEVAKAWLSLIRA